MPFAHASLWNKPIVNVLLLHIDDKNPKEISNVSDYAQDWTNTIIFT